MSADKNEKLYRAIGMIDEKYIEEADMRKFKLSKKTILIAAAAAVMLCGSAVATNSIISGRVGSSSNKPVYTEPADSGTILRDFGFGTELVKEFENGYVFKAAYKGDSRDIDSEGKAINEFNTLTCKYANGSEDVILSAEPAEYNSYEEYETAGVYNGIEIVYSEQLYKFVPPDYVKTEQDEIDEVSGKYVFSYGSDEVEISDFKWLGWMQDGVAYSLSGHDISLTEQELMDMAEEVIDCQT